MNKTCGHYNLAYLFRGPEIMKSLLLQLTGLMLYFCSQNGYARVIEEVNMGKEPGALDLLSRPRREDLLTQIIPCLSYNTWPVCVKSWLPTPAYQQQQ